MSDPYNTLPPNPPGTNPPRHVAEPSAAPWIGGAVAIAVVFGLGFWFMNKDSKPGVTNPGPAVTSAPSVPASRDETTGQAQPMPSQEPQAPMAR
jgi:hypothetical protein